MMEQIVRSLVERVRQARDAKTPLAIHGGNSKSFYGGAEKGYTDYPFLSA